MSTSMSSPLATACRTVTPPARPGFAPSRALPSRTTIRLGDPFRGNGLSYLAHECAGCPCSVPPPAGWTGSDDIGRVDQKHCSSLVHDSPGRRTRVANCAQHGWVPRHLGGRMRGDAQPGARQWRGVQPGHRLQGDGVSPSDQEAPGIVDGDGRDRPHRIRLGLGGGCEGRETRPLHAGGNSSQPTARREDLVSRSGTYPLVALLRFRLNRGDAVLFPKLWWAR